MTRRPREGHSESRTKTVGKKRSLDNTNNRSRKRRRNNPEHQPRDSLLTENSYSTLSRHSDLGEASEIEFSAHDSTHPANVADQIRSSQMAAPNLGRNRLAMGFVRPNSTRHEHKSSGEISDDSSQIINAGKSSVSPIEISDDEMEESEGGMVINVDQDDTPIHIASDDTRSQESGEVSSPPNIGSDGHDNATNLFVVDPLPTRTMKRLIDLNETDLDDQLKYAFFHLDRDRIDLSRPTICLSCISEGHTHRDCEQKPTSTFAASKPGPNTQIKLWISCCVCASKSHLVGDCPHISSNHALRWSLKALDPSRIINMSLETGTAKLEKEAENRNMRPKGLQIKGRAGMHHAGVQNVRGSSEDDDDEPFLRKPIGKRPTNAPTDSRHSPRYDRYDPPSSQQPYRGGGQWYNTDSFGRRRSRSPDGRLDSFRPRGDHPPPRDSYRPGPSDDHREPYRSRLPSPPHGSRVPASNNRGTSGPGAGPSVQFSLPTRKGSNTWSQNEQSGNNTPNTNGKSGGAQQAKKKKPRGGSRKRALKGGHVF